MIPISNKTIDIINIKIGNHKHTLKHKSKIKNATIRKTKNKTVSVCVLYNLSFNSCKTNSSAIGRYKSEYIYVETSINKDSSVIRDKYKVFIELG